ncbi:Shikimate dehydrogenase [[Clostridium] ultunense Esp]|uniref:shikimate dehydrogenase n=1 Tax=Thermicanus aegyptius TaxID=94009 RepID=UPI0002B709C6|nr:shikimate dehydrogenase [Thermicanus aegyptius]CCQ93699.1 Shikimate dehydrogenase [[Clostridium] ultunense Esp]
MALPLFVDSKTSLYGLFGNPVAHSLSPVMQQAAFMERGFNAVYLAFAIQKEKLKEAVEAIRALSIQGVNVTIPYKVEVIPFLDEVEEEASIIGAVNTIKNEGGRLRGYNTDGKGFIRSLEEEFHPDWSSMNGTILGAGGAVRSVAVALARKGVKRITIVNRNREKAEELARLISAWTSVQVEGWERLSSTLKGSNLLINGTPIGMHPHVEETPVAQEALHQDLIVSELVYTPLYTRLLREAKEKGAKIHPGLMMFVYQGAIAFEIWTGKTAPVNLMEQVVRERLSAL